MPTVCNDLSSINWRLIKQTGSSFIEWWKLLSPIVDQSGIWFWLGVYTYLCVMLRWAWLERNAWEARPQGRRRSERHQRRNGRLSVDRRFRLDGNIQELQLYEWLTTLSLTYLRVVFESERADNFCLTVFLASYLLGKLSLLVSLLQFPYAPTVEFSNKYQYCSATFWGMVIFLIPLRPETILYKAAAWVPHIGEPWLNGRVHSYTHGWQFKLKQVCNFEFIEKYELLLTDEKHRKH